MSIHEMIVKELYNKSIAAFILTLEQGRELTLKYNGIEYSITWDQKHLLYLGNEKNDSIDKFHNAWDLLQNAKIQGKSFLEIWNDIELLILY